MQKKEIVKLFNEFATNYEEEAKTSIWKKHSQTFRDFWNKRLLNPDEKEINESEADQIIKILDVHAKGHTKKKTDGVKSFKMTNASIHHAY